MLTVKEPCGAKTHCSSWRDATDAANSSNVSKIHFTGDNKSMPNESVWHRMGYGQWWNDESGIVRHDKA